MRRRPRLPRDPDLLARFWAAALGYELEPPPAGFATWNDYRRDVGVPEAELGPGEDCIACHMPRPAVADIPHTVTTNHRIPRVSGAADPRPPRLPTA